MKTFWQAAIAWCVSMALFSASENSWAAQRTRLPVPPHPAPLPAPPDINLEEFQRRFARGQAAALRKASRSRQSVMRRFIIGWEMHHGYFLIPPAAPNKLVSPDFLDEGVRAQFDRENRQDVISVHVGQRLVCECEGLAWSYYGPRFIVRAAKLTWTD